jgi:predicted SAM-dependent methyltransferase
LRTLDVGCGIHKQPGSIGIDRNPASRADVLVDLDRFPYPFADGSFDRLTAIHVIEHVAHAQEPSEQFQLPLLRRESRGLRLLFEIQIS